MTFEFWQKWLTYANVITIIVGLLLVFASDSIFFDLHNQYTTTVFFGGDEIASDVALFKQWIYAIVGASAVGFHILMIFISENAFKAKERWGYWAMWYGLLSWFILDTGISIVLNAYHNVILINLPALFLIGLPLVMTKKYFRKER